MLQWKSLTGTKRLEAIKSGVLVMLVGLMVFACSSTPSPRPTTPVHPEDKPVRRPKPYRVGRYWYQPLPDARDYKEKGIASWYGKDFHGKKTSNGEVYDMYAMTAAHKTLPLGVFVRVTNLNNKKSIEVRINDRGPFVRGRIIDLSYTAAQKLDIVGPGTAPVEVLALGAPPSPDGGNLQGQYTKVDFFSGTFTIQVGAFSNQDNADRLKEKLGQEYDHAHIIAHNTGSNIYYRVRVGNYTNLDDAEHSERKLINGGYPGVFIVAE